MSLAINRETILKFDRPGPRYTSYPTAPVWNQEVDNSIYLDRLKQFGRSDKTLSLYIHIPFCQSLCSFCACNVIIRKQEDRFGDEYLDYLEREIELVSAAIGKKPTVRQLHWGGGTPTFLNEAQIERLYKKIQQHFHLAQDAEVAIEIDPRTIDESKLKLLKRLGFNRVSMGVQDFNEEVQHNINRPQPFAMVKKFYDWCRELKFHSVNFDLVYGLPEQTPQSFRETVEQVIGLRPDRIALYSFAYVPWLKKHQRKFEKNLLPESEAKLEIFLNSREQFLKQGYAAIAMDHFALTEDELATAFHENRLYRNFMGYTVKPADEFIGLGLTSIGFLENTFIQNVKVIGEYYESLKNGKLPVERGKSLTTDDQIRQYIITSLMCQFFVDKDSVDKKFGVQFDQYFEHEQTHLQQCAKDGLITFAGSVINVTELGKLFIRNVCMGFDFYLRQQQAVEPKFSRTI